MDLEDYIESGIIESYLLGLATHEEVAKFERMRNIYPQLNGEIATMEYKLQKLGEEGSIAPPAQVWNSIAEKIQWETPAYTKSRTGPHTLIIKQQSRKIPSRSWWRSVFVALFLVFLISTAYFYHKYSGVERHLLHLYPVSQAVGK